MKKVALSTLVVAGLAVSSFAMPASYKTCVACHGPKGEKGFAAAPTKVPANLTKAQVVTALKGYKDGSYGGPTKGLMKGQVMKLTDADINELAEYIGK